MDTGNSEFHQGFRREAREVKGFEFGKCSRNFLGSLLTFQEVEKLSTWIYFSYKGCLWPWLSLRGYLGVFRTQK